MSSIKPLSDEKIVDSWKKNFRPWISAIKNNEISSRVQVTNQAICDVVVERSPKKVLDVGCGEGWLVRELVSRGIEALGIDAIPEFIESAIKSSEGRFSVLPYEKLSDRTLQEKYDVVVCNFSLLGEDVVNYVFQQIPALLENNGAFIVQTIHPINGCGEGKYEDGWREGSWAGFSEQFSEPAPWYFRTLETWILLFTKSGFDLRKIYEPKNQESDVAASIVFVAEIAS